MAHLTLKLPIQGSIAQGFGRNDNTSYAQNGLAGHPAVDVVSFYGDTITNAVVTANNQYVYSLLNKDNPDLSRYRGVVQIVEADNGVFELCYGHCNHILCSLGPTTAAQALATEGNTGEVYAGGREVTRAEKDAGSHLGFHVHFQVRRLKKVRETTFRSISYDGIHDLIDPEGYHFDVPNYDNGYNGTIDPMQFIGPQSNYPFTRDLDVGSYGPDVFQLQKRLVRLGFGAFTPIGVYGPKTREAVKLLQEAYGLEQVGRCGIKTRAALNSN